MAKICIDPGHGGSDPGAVGQNGLKEKDATLEISTILYTLLEEEGHTVVMTRYNDSDVGYAADSAEYELQSRCNIANSSGADIFISVHCNAFNEQANGTETWYCADSEAGKRAALAVQNMLVAKLGLTDRGIKNTHQERLYVLLYTNMPAILVEAAFISNPDEEELLGDEDGQTKIAQAIADGLEAYLRG